MNYKILKDLISFNTIEDKENNDIINYIKEYLETLNFKVQLLNLVNKKALVATYGVPNLCFIGHTDTVKCSSNWKTNPFELKITDNKMYGLGVCDMKGGIAAFLDTLKNINLDKLKKGIQIIITFDEEIGFEGIKLIKNSNIIIPDNVLIGEPTNLIPVVACKGCMEYKVKFLGKSAHSSRLIYGDNAIISCLKFVKELIEFAESLKEIKSDLFEDIPYTTMNIGLINGGTAINMVPDECYLSFDFRTISKSEQDRIQETLEKVFLKYNLEYELFTNIYPCKVENKEVLKNIEAITNKKPISYSYVTEGNIINKNNVVILGPGPVTAHEDNEYIEVSSYEDTKKIYKKIIEFYCKGEL